MDDRRNSAASLHEFATWAPLLRLLRAEHAGRLAVLAGDLGPIA